MNPPSPLHSPEQAAKYLNTTTSSLERWRTAGTGPAFVKIGRRVAYTKEDLDDWIQQQRRTMTTERRAKTPTEERRAQQAARERDARRIDRIARKQYRDELADEARRVKAGTA